MAWPMFWGSNLTARKTAKSEAKGVGERAPLARCEEPSQADALTVRGDDDAAPPLHDRRIIDKVDGIRFVDFQAYAGPIRLKRPMFALTARLDTVNGQFNLRQAHPFAQTAGAVTEPKCQIDGSHVQAQKADHRPGIGEEKRQPHGQTDKAHRRHKYAKAPRAQASVWPQFGIEQQRRLPMQSLSPHKKQFRT